jgi:hypothetical protein
MYTIKPATIFKFMENNQREDISKFIESITSKYGFVPKFAHNLVAKDKKEGILF